MKNNRYSISIRHALMLLVLLLGFPYFGYAEYDIWEDVDEDGLHYQINVTQGYAECYGYGVSGNIVIPSSIFYKTRNKYYPVTQIGRFQGDSITSITIPESVTTICSSAFWGCSGLTSIEIPNSVTTIGSNAFYGCSGLTSIKIPNGVASIGDYAFYGCSGLTSIEIPNSVTSIADGTALMGCSRLYSIKLPKCFPGIYTKWGSDNLDGTNVYYLAGEYEQKSSDFPNLLLRDDTENHKRLWDGAKIIKTSLTDSLELANYLSGLTITNPQVLIVPTGCYDYVVESVAQEMEGLSIIEDQNMQFSITSWEDDLWKLAKGAYAQLNEITQLSSFTSLKTDLQNRIKDMLRDCTTLQKDREKKGNFSRYNVTYTCLSLYNENLCLMLPLLLKAQELHGEEELLYIDEKVYSDFNTVYQDAFNCIKEHPLLITKQEIKKMQMSYDAALAACNGIRNFYSDLRNLLQLADSLKNNEWYVKVPDSQKTALDQAIEDAQTIVDEGEYDASLQPIKTTLQNVYDGVLAWNRLNNLLQLVDTLKKVVWYDKVADAQKTALDQAVGNVQTIINEQNYEGNWVQAETSLQSAYQSAIISGFQELVSQVKSYTETDIANIYPYLDGKKVLNEVMAQAMAELNTDNYSSMLQIADSLQAAYDNVKIEAEKYNAELQSAKQNANQLVTDAITLQNETYKDIYAYLDADTRNAFNGSIETTEQKVAGYDKNEIVQATNSLQTAYDNVKIETEKYNTELQSAKQNANQLLTNAHTLQNETYKDIYIYLDANNRSTLDNAIKTTEQEIAGYDKNEIVQATNSLQAACDNVKTEAENYNAELQSAKWNANQLLTNAHTLQNETYKDIYIYLDANNRSTLDNAIKTTEQEIAGYDKNAIMQAVDNLEKAYKNICDDAKSYADNIRSKRIMLFDEISKASQLKNAQNETYFYRLDEEFQNNYEQALQNANDCSDSYSVADVVKAKEDLSEICSNILGMYDYMIKSDNLIAQLNELPQKYPYSYEAIDSTYKKQIDEAIQNASKKATSIAQLQQTFQQMQLLYDSTLVLINDLQDKHFDNNSLERISNLIYRNGMGRETFDMGYDYYSHGMVTDFSQVISTNNNHFYTYLLLERKYDSGSFLQKGDYVDIRLDNNLDHSCLMLVAKPNDSYSPMQLKVYFKNSIDNKWECIKNWEATSEFLPLHGFTCVFDFNKITKNIDTKYIRLEYVGEKECDMSYLMFYRRDDLMDDDDYQRCDSMIPLLRSQVEKNDVQRSLTKEMEELTSNFIDDAQGSATYVDFRQHAYASFMPDEDILISDVAKDANVVCEVDGQVYRRTVEANNDAYLVKGSPVILHGSLGSCINLQRKSGGILGQPVDTTGNILKISKESDSVDGGYVFEQGKFYHTDYQVFENAGIAYFKFGNLNLGESFNIEELEEVRPVVSPVSTVTDNHTELRVYDVSGRYIPVKELDKLPAGAYIVNGKKVVVK
ncbi:leucine-rich repeat protein [Prevotellamassilia timonensis]|uniref:leucine-rich repeat protein n=1 Tax=Prevotellamassilia timonensis TaxID=1852370 RepID=UPI003FD8988A